MAGGSQKKTCPNCRESIYCGNKICPLCKHPQPNNVRLKKKMDKFQSQQKQWLSSMTKNRIKSHVLDDAALLLEKLHALGLKPLLLLAYPPTKRVPRTPKMKVLMPMHAQLSTSAKTCLDNVEAIFKLMVAGWTRLNPDQEENPDTPTPPQDPPNQLPDGSYILNLVPCDPSPITHNQQPQETADPPPHQAPSTHPPPHQAPSTHPPPNQAPSTHPPPHQAPSTHPPPNQAPSTHPPPHQAPSTHPPPHQAPSTHPPPNQAPSTHPPPHQAPSTHPPPHQAPSTHPPPNQAPSTHPLPNQAPSTHPPPNQAPSTHPPPNQAPSTHPPPNQVQIMLEPSRQIPPMRQPRKRAKTMKDCSHNHLEVFPVRKIIKTRNRKGGTEHLYDWEPCTICGMSWPPSWQAA
ncbi:hypothetical protein OYC64_016028 [Pagothenia borchgrevinki]|uniref:Uncharacterized protein n=1 Tax=Pagothenia borchgrevinki TaxID=8213 RepID=A0ABD2HID0_PAGBO